MRRRWGTLALTLLAALPLAAQDQAYSRADTLRGSWTTPGRSWWDVGFYDLAVAIHPADSTISGRNAITYRVVGTGRELQIDLMTPLVLDSVVQGGRALPLRHDGNAHFATLPAAAPVGSIATVTAWYHGRPRIAPRPPWDGGFSWTSDSLGRPWVVTTDQGVGASIWWPNKDTQADEPDSQRVAITVPDSMVHVGPGRLRSTTHHPDGTTTWEWFASNPINNYAIAVAAASYGHLQQSYMGEAGRLTLDFFPLDYHLAAARSQWVQARPMLQCFEHWFGPYPFYADGYKLVEVPNNGMEHQTAVAYGNRFANGYQRRDGSGTGLGMEWDFIIVHESAHEWWGNNITTRDLADMWVHESFANYAEGLYVECLFGKEAGARYVIGNRRGIRNDRPIVPAARGVNAQGSGDMYPKGGNMLHTIRQIVADDDRWREILRGLQSDFRHQVVDGDQVERYISARAGVDLSKVFEQYLTTTQIPTLQLTRSGTSLRYRWNDVVAGFDMPIDVRVGDWSVRLHPTTAWQGIDAPADGELKVDENYYVKVATAVP